MSNRTKATDKLGRATRSRIGYEMPDPLSTRLDALVDLAAAVGLTTSRTELISAAVLSLPTGSPELEEVVASYRTATAGEAIFPVRRRGELPLRNKTPGPRPRSS